MGSQRTQTNTETQQNNFKLRQTACARLPKPKSPHLNEI